MSNVWKILQYGWQHAHLLTIEGIATPWAEMDGLSVPTGFGAIAVDTAGRGTLVIESAEIGQQIDRKTGIGVGYPLGFKLADNVDFSLLKRRQSYAAVLTSTASATVAVINVSSAQDWSAIIVAGTGVFWLGIERIEFTGVTTVAGVTTQFTGCTRGTAGGYGQIHLAGQPGAICSDVPKYWRGREVRLYAQPISPAGLVVDGAVEIWRGFIDFGAEREAGFWSFEALSLDRKLTQPLTPAITGTVISMGDKFLVNPAWSATLQFNGFNGAGAATWTATLALFPFLGMSGLLSEADIFAAFKAAFDASVAASAVAAAHVNSVTFNNSAIYSLRHMHVSMKADAATTFLTTAATVKSTYLTDVCKNQHSYNGGVPANADNVLLWMWQNWSHPFGGQTSNNTGQLPQFGAITIQLDKAPDFAVPDYGVVKIGDLLLQYQSTATIGPLLYLYNLQLNGKPQPFEKSMIGAKCNIVPTSFQGTPATSMLLALQSGGTAGQHGAYDTLNAGYSVDQTAIDLQSFTQFDGVAGGVTLTASSADADFAKLFGPFMALLQYGLCARQVGDVVQLSIVTTDPGGSNPVATLTDADLLTGNGWPITSKRSRSIPNAILLTQSQGGDVIAEDSAFDPSIALNQGGISLAFDIPAAATEIDSIAAILASAGQSLLIQSQSLQEVEIACVPWWHDVRIGDLIAMVLTDPSVWQYATATVGYTGNARITGIKRDAGTGAVTLVALLDGERDTGNLSPAALVAAWQGAAGAPTRIDVTDADGDWSMFFASCLDSAAPFELAHYQPGAGDENTADGYTFSAVALVAGVCQLTVAAVLGAPTLSTAARSTLTLPVSASCSAFEALFSHAEDGTKWA